MTAMPRLAALMGVVSFFWGLASTSALVQWWEFSTGSTEGWNVGQSVSNLRTSGGSLVGDVTGLDPYLIGPRYPDIDASTLRYIPIHMKTDAGSRAEFFWQRVADPSFKPGREVAFVVNADNQFHEYTVDMSAHSERAGTVHTLRLDPSDLANGRFEIDYIRVVSSAPAVLEASVPSAADRFAFAGEQVTVSVTVSNTGYSLASRVRTTLARVDSVDFGARLRFTFARSDMDGGQWQSTMVCEMADGSDLISAWFTLNCPPQRSLLYWTGPSLCAGNRGFGSAKSQALFPGLEWFAGSEQSPNTLESAPGSNLNVTPHPYKVTLPLMAVGSGGTLVALLWDPLQKWDGTNICASACFSSPNWLEGQENHLMQLPVATVPRWLSESSTSASTPYTLAASSALVQECRCLARVEAGVPDADEQWYSTFGVPALPSRSGLLECDLRATRSGVMNTLWNSASKGWPHVVSETPSPHPVLFQDPIADSLSESNPATRASLKARADEALQKRISLSDAIASMGGLVSAWHGSQSGGTKYVVYVARGASAA